MTARRRVLMVAGLLFSAAALPASESPVVGHDLKQLRAPGISAVMWTRRSSTYTLQIVFPGRGFRVGNVAAAPSPQPVSASNGNPSLPYPDIRAWVLHASGAALSPLRRHAVTGTKATPVARSAQDNTARTEINYEFDLATGEEAVAVALSVHGQFYIEKLAPL